MALSKSGVVGSDRDLSHLNAAVCEGPADMTKEEERMQKLIPGNMVT